MKNLHASDAEDCLNNVMINLDQAAIHLVMAEIPVLQEFKKVHEMAQEIYNTVCEYAAGKK